MTNVLNPYWITGFSDAEGCFHVSFTKRPYRKVKVEVRPSFSLTQSPRSRFLLGEFESYFQCGAVRYSKKDGFYRYEVRSTVHLVEKIIPHFSAYPLHSPKKEDFEKFQEICMLVSKNKHLSGNQLTHILELAYSMNPPGKRKHEKKDLLKLLSYD